MLDAHTHLNSDQLYPTRKQYFRNFCDNGGTWLVNIGVNNHRNTLNLDIQKQRKVLKKEDPSCADISCSLGLHPCETVFGNIKNKDILDQEMQKLEQLVQDNRKDIVALGECGIDAHHKRDNTIRDLQIELFHRQCILATQQNLPIVIHSRSQRDITMEVLSQYTELKVNLHCRSYTVQHIKKAMDTFPRLRIGFCGNITYKKAIDIQESLDKYAQAGGKFLLETDAPYLSPSPLRGKQNEPAHITYTYERVSERLGISKKEVIKQVYIYGKELYDMIE